MPSNSAAYPKYSTLIDFGSQTARGAWRGTATGTVDRYVRVSSSGTFTSATFAVVFCRNQAQVDF